MGSSGVSFVFEGRTEGWMKVREARPRRAVYCVMLFLRVSVVVTSFVAWCLCDMKRGEVRTCSGSR